MPKSHSANPTREVHTKSEARPIIARELILKECHEYAEQADQAGDDGTNDLLVSDVMRLNELQAWFVAEHLVPEPLVIAGSN